MAGSSTVPAAARRPTLLAPPRRTSLALPGGVAPSGRRDSSVGAGRRPSAAAADANLTSNFTTTSFIPEAYLQSSLTVDNEEALQGMQRSLLQYREKSILELKKSVYRNYLDFINVAKETGQIETDLNTLRTLIGQMRGLSGDIGTVAANAAAEEKSSAPPPRIEFNASTIAPASSSTTTAPASSSTATAPASSSTATAPANSSTTTAPGSSTATGPNASAVTMSGSRTRSKHQRSASANLATKLDLGLPDIPLDRFNATLGMLKMLNEASSKCQYDTAVEYVDKIKYELSAMDLESPRMHTLKKSLEAQVAKLSAFLFREISTTHIGKGKMGNLIQALVVLGFADEAREKFLASRSDLIREKAREIIYNGDISRAIKELSLLTFSTIRKTATLYNYSFKDVTMTAGFVYWVKTEITNFVALLAKQLFQDETESELIGECIEIARSHCKLLREIGLDFVFLLDELLFPHIDIIIGEYQEECEEELMRLLKSEDFEVPLNSDDPQRPDIAAGCCITSVAVEFHQIVVDFMIDLEPLLSEETSNVLIRRVIMLFESFSMMLLKRFYLPEMSNSQVLNIISNIVFLSTKFLPSFTENMEKRFSCDFPELIKLKARLEAAVHSMYQIFADRCVERMLPISTLSAYAEEVAVPDDAVNSAWINTMLPVLAKVARDIETTRREHVMQLIVTTIFASIQRRLEENSIELSVGGAQIFVLDIQMLMMAFAPFLTEESTLTATKLSDGAMESIRKGGHGNNIKPESWYTQRVENILSTTAKYMLDFGTD